MEFIIQDASALPLLNSINEGNVDLGITVKPAAQGFIALLKAYAN